MTRSRCGPRGPARFQIWEVGGHGVDVHGVRYLLFLRPAEWPCGRAPARRARRPARRGGGRSRRRGRSRRGVELEPDAPSSSPRRADRQASGRRGSTRRKCRSSARVDCVRPRGRAWFFSAIGDEPFGIVVKGPGGSIGIITDTSTPASSMRATSLSPSGSQHWPRRRRGVAGLPRGPVVPAHLAGPALAEALQALLHVGVPVGLQQVDVAVHHQRVALPGACHAHGLSARLKADPDRLGLGVRSSSRRPARGRSRSACSRRRARPRRTCRRC